MNTIDTGSNAEKLVADKLKLEGYKIVELNWRRPHAEIDIIAEKNKVTYFVEVKYRSNNSAGDGFDYITATKLKHMERAANSWVQENDWQGEFELLAVSVVGDTIKLVAVS